MTPREFHALRAVWVEEQEAERYRHAELMALLMNAHWDNKGVPWNAADLMGKGDRQKRQVQHAKDKIQMFQLNRRDREDPEESLPDWARGRKGKVN